MDEWGERGHADCRDGGECEGDGGWGGWQEVKELVTCDSWVVDLQPTSKTMPSLAPLRETLEAAGLGEAAVQECLQVVETDICGQLVSELKEERQKKNRLLLQLASLEVGGAEEGRKMMCFENKI